jgi:phospholipase A1
VFDASFNNELASDNRSDFEVNWAFSLAQHLRVYVQFFTGYGENMIDMGNNDTRIGVGVALTEWL